MTPEELIALLYQCRENNRQKEITGMLLYHEGSFMQVLEGPEADVDQLLKIIERDARHKGVLQLLRGDLAERQFSKWSMGFRDIRDLTPQDRVAVSDFIDSPFTAASYVGDPHRSLKLLQNFKKLMTQ